MKHEIDSNLNLGKLTKSWLMKYFFGIIIVGGRLGIETAIYIMIAG
jgi:hypothetical protein